LSLLQSDSILESANAVIHVSASSRLYVSIERVKAKRQVQVNLPCFIGLLGRDTDNLETATAQRYAGTDYFRIRMESSPPQLFAENNYIGSPGIFHLSKGSTEEKWPSQHIEKTARYIGPVDPFGASVCGDLKIITTVDGQVL